MATVKHAHSHAPAAFDTPSHVITTISGGTTTADSMPIPTVARQATSRASGVALTGAVRTETAPPGRQLHRSARRTAHGAWQRGYVARLVVLDVLAVSGSSWTAYLFGGPVPLQHSRIAFATAMVFLPCAWVLSMVFCRAYERRFLGVGSEEFRRVLVGALGMLAVVGTTSWAFQLDLARGYVIIALPMATLLTLGLRYALRKSLHQRRRRGECQSTILIAGHAGGVLAMANTMRRASYHGMDIVSACIPGGPNSAAGRALAELGIPVDGDLSEIVNVARDRDVDAVAVLGGPELDSAALRRLGWGLEATRAELLVAPGVTEVVGPRVAIRPVCGLPLLHVERPELTGVRRIAKGLFDRCAAATVLVLLSPVLLSLAIWVALDSSGGVLFRQRRVGRAGKEFTMIKFRSMVANADSMVPDLEQVSDGNEMLFKMRQDPRVTKVGRLLRKYSLDELPQLFNVVRGEMSLVGPRPPLPREVALYGADVWRRLLVKPGLTGLWQINGRSELDWEESLRLDLRYVENWSFTFDLMILWKTASAVLAGRGAY